MSQQELNWYQKNNEVTISIISEKNDEINFSLEPEIINYLAGNTPKFYIFFIKLKSEKEKQYFVDFNTLKSVASTKSVLKITVGKKNKLISTKYQGLTTKGMYCIARGESFYERYLSDTGWIRQKKYYDLYEIEEVKTNISKEIKPKQKEIKQNDIIAENKISVKGNKPKAKLMECKNCQEIIPGNFEVCPYCNANQFSVENLDVDIQL